MGNPLSTARNDLNLKVTELVGREGHNRPPAWVEIAQLFKAGPPYTSAHIANTELTMHKSIAEFIGTFALVLFGCGAAAIGGMGTGPTAIDVLGIAFAFGLAIVAMAYGIGPI
jgi:hypothetical protein